LFWNVSDVLQGQAAVLDLPSDCGEGGSRDEFVHLLVGAAERGSNTAMWMIAQLRLVSMTSDIREDVRNGAVHTIFRILDSCGDRMSEKIWDAYIRSVLLPMLENHSRVLPKFQDLHELTSMEPTLKVILQGLNGTFATSFETLAALPAFEEIWGTLLVHLKAFLHSGAYSVNKAVFDSVAQMLTSFEGKDKIGQRPVRDALELWIQSIPVPTETMTATNANDDALVAYVKLLQPICRLLSEHIEAQDILTIMRNLGLCIELSVAASYGSDIDTTTKLQNVVLQGFGNLRTDFKGVPLAMIAQLAAFTVLPYKQQNNHQNPKQCSFVAFAKKAMKLLEITLAKHAENKEVYNTKGYLAAVFALNISVRGKYQVEPQGKAPALWLQAASTAVSIVEKTTPFIQDFQLDEPRLNDIWSATLELFDAIAHATLPVSLNNLDIISDESFDIQALQKLCSIMNPCLASDRISSKVLDSYLASLFTNSLIHAPHTSELPSLPGDQLLKDLYKVRFGRTSDSPFNRRIRVSYICLDELFSLAMTHEQHSGERLEVHSDHLNPGHGKLAQMALPYLVLRCALPLKSYIADQPLRGRMPTPQSQRLELLHILGKIKTLRCDPSRLASQGNGGSQTVNSGHIKISDSSRRHLEWLAPLVNRALGEAGRDVEVRDALRSVMDIVIGVL